MDRENIILDFVASSIGSVWALEVLLQIKESARPWTKDELVAELRGSDVAIREALQLLHNAGLVLEGGRAYAYAPLSLELRQITDELAVLYRSKPVTVISAIANAPRRKLKILSDAFRLRRD